MDMNRRHFFVALPILVGGVISSQAAESWYWLKGKNWDTEDMRKHLLASPHNFPKEYVVGATRRELADWHDIHHLRRWKKGLNGKPPMKRTANTPLPTRLPWE